MSVPAIHEPPSLLARVLFYAVLAGIGACAFSDSVMQAFPAAGNTPALIAAACCLLAFYLPLLDWPYLAWCYTRRLRWAAGAFAIAVLLPFGVPVILNARSVAAAPSPLLTPRHTVVAGHILLVGEGGVGDDDACGDFCQRLLWSGMTDHVLARRGVVPGQHLTAATLFTVEKADHCVPLEGASPPSPRGGLCIARQPISNPTFDVLLQFGPRQVDSPSLLPFGRKLDVDAMRQPIRIYNCHMACEEIANVTQWRSENLAVPVWLTFRPDAGFFFARRPLWINGPARIFATVLDVYGRSDGPRSGFHAEDAAQGGPYTPDPTDDSGSSDTPRTVRHHGESTEQYVHDVDDSLARYRAAIHAVEAQHKDCARPIIRPGPIPAYMGCGDPQR